MREILFRGKRRDNGKWIEGHLHKMDGYGTGYTEYGIQQQFGTATPWSMVVIPETVGQFTGLVDRYGTKIFEGDIVDVEYYIQYVGTAAERIGLFEVVFDGGCFMKKNKKGLFHFIPSDKCKVVGNIHDNPELLKAAKG